MTPLDSIKTAFEALRANLLRSLLTTLGIIIGVAAVILVVAIGSGAREVVVNQIRSLGTNLMIVQSVGPRLTLSEDEAYAIPREIPEVQTAAPVIHGGVQAIRGAASWPTTMYGTTPDFREARDWGLRSGRDFSTDEMAAAGKVVILGETVARTLFGDGDPIGAVLRVQNVPFLVVGVLTSKGQTGTGRDQDDILLVPLKTARERIVGINPVNPGAIDMIMVKAFEGEDVQAIEQEIRALLRERHRLGAHQDDDFSIRNLAEVMQIKEASTRAFAMLVAAIASVSLVVGGIGIMNIMLVSVLERTREIGIRLAVGARRRDIMVQFLIESITLAAAGGAIGLLLGALLAVAVAAIAGWPTEIRAEAIALAVGCSVGVGVLFGFYPARRAARLDPIEALRRV